LRSFSHEKRTSLAVMGFPSLHFAPLSFNVIVFAVMSRLDGHPSASSGCGCSFASSAKSAGSSGRRMSRVGADAPAGASGSSVGGSDG